MNYKSALNFNSERQAYVKIPHDESLSITGDLTVEFWLYLNKWSTGWSDIISKFNNDKNNEFCFRTRDSDLGQWYYGDRNNAIILNWIPKEDIGLQEWTHIAAVRKIGEYGRLYFNGVLFREIDLVDKQIAASTKAPIMLMGRQQQNRYQNGKMCELRIWKVVRTPEEIQYNIKKELTGNEKGLIGYWKFNEGKGKSAIDYAGHNHPVLYNTHWTDFNAQGMFNINQRKSKIKEIKNDAQVSKKLERSIRGEGVSPKLYQSFEGLRGASNSKEKLKAIKLPNDLKGKSVLDIGCAEGFFCIEAKKRGADSVLGIDSDQKKLAHAKAIAPDITYMQLNWDNLPKDKFDIILHLSAFHYARKPRQLLKDIHSRLSDNGLFILECGMIDNDKKELVRVERGKDVRYFPTRGLLIQNYLQDFAVKLVNESVMQSGDPIKRYVFHCRKRMPIILLVRGKSDDGKTVLSNELKKLECQIIRADGIFHQISREQRNNYDVEQYIKDKYLEYEGSISKIVREIDKNSEMVFELVEIICQYVSLEERIIIIEGYALTDSVVKALNKKFDNVAIIWEINRVME